MEIFDWHPSPGEQVVSPYIWIYWAIVGPLTVFVAAFVMSFIAAKSSSGYVTARNTNRSAEYRQDHEHSPVWEIMRDVVTSRRNGGAHSAKTGTLLKRPAIFPHRSGGESTRIPRDVESGHTCGI